VDHTTDAQFTKTMSIVVGALVIFFFAILFAANLLVEPSNVKPNETRLATIAARIVPVGSVRTSVEGVDDVAASAASAESTAQPKSGKQLADTVCLACHGAATAAVLNAPAIGDAAAWDSRLSAGMDTLVSNAINGKGAMPPRGGSSLSDEEMRLAVEYLSSAQ
jgi:cytochrome c5